MNATSSAIVGVATLVFSLNSSESSSYDISNFKRSLNSQIPISETQKLVTLQNMSAWGQAVSLFPDVRGFTREEMLTYKESLSSLFKKTGRRIF
jgi:hypothetical protein